MISVERHRWPRGVNHHPLTFNCLPCFGRNISIFTVIAQFFAFSRIFFFYYSQSTTFHCKIQTQFLGKRAENKCLSQRKPKDHFPCFFFLFVFSFCFVFSEDTLRTVDMFWINEFFFVDLFTGISFPLQAVLC